MIERWVSMVSWFDPKVFSGAHMHHSINDEIVLMSEHHSPDQQVGRMIERLQNLGFTTILMIPLKEARSGAYHDVALKFEPEGRWTEFIAIDEETLYVCFALEKDAVKFRLWWR